METMMFTPLLKLGELNFEVGVENSNMWIGLSREQGAGGYGKLESASFILRLPVVSFP